MVPEWPPARGDVRFTLQKRTFSEPASMSAKGHKQKSPIPAKGSLLICCAQRRTPRCVRVMRVLFEE